MPNDYLEIAYNDRSNLPIDKWNRIAKDIVSEDAQCKIHSGNPDCIEGQTKQKDCLLLITQNDGDISIQQQDVRLEMYRSLIQSQRPTYSTIITILQELVQLPWSRERNELIYISMKKAPTMRLSQKQFTTIKRKNQDSSDSSHKLLDNLSRYELHIQDFQAVVGQIGENDCSFLYQRQNILEQYLLAVIIYWGQLTSENKALFERFLGVVDTKLDKNDLNRTIFPSLVPIRQRLIGMVQPDKGSILNNKPYKCLSDALFRYYIEQIKEILKTKIFYYYHQDYNMSNISFLQLSSIFINYFSENEGWKEILTLTNKHYTGIGVVFHEKFPVQEINSPQSQCLGCTERLFWNCQIKCPIKCHHSIIFGGSVLNLRQDQNFIKDEICSLLNGEGGMIFFGCKYNEVNKPVPIGDNLYFDQKNEVQGVIQELIDEIHPQFHACSFINFSFIPIALYKDNYEDSIEGLYVTRILIKPQKIQRAYSWMQNDRQIFAVRVKNKYFHGKIEFKTGQQTLSFCKHQFNRFDSSLSNILNINVCTTANHSFDNSSHACKQLLNPQSYAIPFQQNPIIALKTNIIVHNANQITTVQRFFEQSNIFCQIRHIFSLNQTNCYAIQHHLQINRLIYKSQGKDYLLIQGKFYQLHEGIGCIKLKSRNKEAPYTKKDFEDLMKRVRSVFQGQSFEIMTIATEQNDYDFLILTGNDMMGLYIYLLLKTEYSQNALQLANRSDSILTTELLAGVVYISYK